MSDVDNFNKTLTATNLKAAMKTADAGSADLWNIDPRKLIVLEDFNVRVQNEAYAKRVRAIADSIKANGFYRDKALAGFATAEGIVITGGHTRLDAVKLAISEGCNIPVVPVVTPAKGTSMEDLTVALVTGNEGSPLTMYEAAVVCKRLAAFGFTSKEIARRLAYSSAQYVDDLLTLAGSPLAVRRMVMDDVISATAAIAAIKKHGDKAHEVIAASLVRAAGGRVTAKHMPDVAFKKVVKKNAKPLYDVVTRIKLTPAFTKLPEELQADVLSLLREIDK